MDFLRSDIGGSVGIMAAVSESRENLKEPSPEKTKAEKAEKAEKKAEKKLSASGLRQKSKNQTTAFRKGLQTITPAEAALTADYSGWIKKRGSSGVGTWKSRFFVLSGRRLSYYYSETDTVEAGFIDITSHRVLPANDERLIGLHAAIAAVTNVPGSGKSPKTVETAETPISPVADEKEGGCSPAKKKDKDQGWFVFKLVPPGPNAVKGVTFTAPRLHYFATKTREDGKKWMAAMMKATIDRDETKPVVTSYNAKTISLAKARALRARPPALVTGEGLGIELGYLMADAEDADVEDHDEAGKRDSGSVEEGADEGILFVDREDAESHTMVILDNEGVECGKFKEEEKAIAEAAAVVAAA